MNKNVRFSHRHIWLSFHPEAVYEFGHKLIRISKPYLVERQTDRERGKEREREKVRAGTRVRK